LALHVGVELCRALRYAHSRTNESGEALNIVHRDVTPANILISTEGEVKLTDFGIARAKGRIHQTQAGVLKGKFGYMPPEMVRYEEIDARADLFCAGVLLYLLAAGRHPVAHASVMDAIQRYETKQVPLPSSANPDIPPELDRAIMKALEPQPSRRWQTAQALGEELQNILYGNPAWRGTAREATKLLSGRLREVAPEVFGEVVPHETLTRLAQEHASPELLPPFHGAETSEASTAAAPPASSGSEGGPSEPSAYAELDTDEGLPYADVQRARAVLKSGEADVPARREGGTDASVPLPDPAADLAIPSTDPNGADPLAEPVLPSQAASSERGDSLANDQTVAAYNWNGGERTLANDDADGATMVGVSIDHLSEPETGRVVAKDLLDEDTLGSGAIDSPTILPRDDGGGAPTAVSQMEPQHSAEADVWGGEGEIGATLLEGLDGGVVRTGFDGADRTLADGLDDEEESALPTFVQVAEENPTYSPPNGAQPPASSSSVPGAPRPSQSRPGAKEAPFAGPIRIVVGADGRPVPASSGFSSGGGVLEGAPVPSEGLDGMDFGTDTGRWIAGELDSSRLGWSDEEAGRRAVATRHQAGTTPPPAVASNGIPQPSYPAPGSPYPPSAGWTSGPTPQYAPSALRRNAPLIVVLGTALLLVGLFVYAWFGTERFWPRLQIETTPSGAAVVVDGERKPGRTPTVIVAPAQRHRIELRAEGHTTAIRDVTEDVGRGHTYLLEVALDRVLPMLHISPVSGVVFINDIEVGRGTDVQLSKLPSTGPLRVRIEAAGHETYEVSFDSIASMPTSMDVPLVEKPEPKRRRRR
ncbi:MAG: protein kinase, partial [Myxococcota bacterium]